MCFSKHFVGLLFVQCSSTAIAIQKLHQQPIQNISSQLHHFYSATGAVFYKRSQHEAERGVDGHLLWAPVPIEEQEESAGRNMCADGKQLPDFYVLGVQKCATSSLAADLMGAGITNVHGDMNPKEFHFFDHRMKTDVPGLDGVKENRAGWTGWMPNCPWSTAEEHSSKRVVLADFTPDYLRIVPRVEDEMKPVGEWLLAHETHVNAPHKMRMLYGGVMSEKINFAVMIREPLAQMQSAWYHAASFGFNNACSSCKADTFQAALSSLIDGLRQNPPQYTAWLWTTMYARQFEFWLAQFSAKQFIVIPTGEYAHGDKDAICRSFAARLSFKINCDSNGRDVAHEWSHEHPAVNEDATGDLRTAFDDLMGNEKTRLVQLFARANTDGMTLANYYGAPGDEGAVRAWLDASW